MEGIMFNIVAKSYVFGERKSFSNTFKSKKIKSKFINLIDGISHCFPSEKANTVVSINKVKTYHFSNHVFQAISCKNSSNFNSRTEYTIREKTKKQTDIAFMWHVNHIRIEREEIINNKYFEDFKEDQEIKMLLKQLFMKYLYEIFIAAVLCPIIVFMLDNLTNLYFYSTTDWNPWKIFIWFGMYVTVRLFIWHMYENKEFLEFFAELKKYKILKSKKYK
jgi:hypothetical protein